VKQPNEEDQIEILKADLEWVEKERAEWRQAALLKAEQAAASRTVARAAIAHLQQVLNNCQTTQTNLVEHQRAVTLARQWLQSLEGEWK
jgi:hypothetical protein